MQQKQCKKLHLFFYLIVIFQFLIKLVYNNYIGIDISVKTTQINILNQYTFTFSRDFNPLTSDFILTPSTVTLNSIIQIVFPADYTYIVNSTTVPCTDRQTGLDLNCVVNQANKTLTVTNYYANSNRLSNLYPSIVISSIKNPIKSGQTANFQYFIKSSTNVIIDQSPSVTNNIYFPRLTFTAGTFNSCKISAKSATILTRSKLHFLLTPKNQIPSSGKLIIQLPLYWTNDLQNNRTLTTTPNCVGVNNISGSISCSFTVMSSPVNKVYITLSDLTSSSVLNMPFQISIQSILTPPYVDSSDSITIYSQWSDGSQIDSCKTNIVDLLPIKFQSITFQSNDSTSVQTSFVGKLSIVLARPFSYEDTIVIIVPQYFINATITSISFSSFSQYKDSSALSLTLNNFPTNSNKSSNSLLNFTLSNIKNPDSVKPVAITVRFFRVGSLYQQSIITYEAISSSTSSFKIIPESAFVNVRGDGEIQINSSLKIPSSSLIKIYYPSTVTSSDFSSFSVNFALLNGININSVNYTVLSNTITFIDLFKTAFTGGSILISFPQFQNPPTVQPSVYLLRVETNDGYLIFNGQVTMTAVLKNLISNTISPFSYKVLDVTTITLTIQTSYASNSISIIIPSEISLKTGFESTCLPNNLTGCYLNSNNLTFEGNFPKGIHTISWGNTQNPNSFQPTSTFSIYTYYRGWGVQKSLGYIYLQMNQTAEFSSILVQPSSLKNNQIINVHFTINFPLNLPSSGTLFILFPSVLDLTSAICNQTCTKISNTIKLEFISLNFTKFQLLISKIKNSPSYQPIDNFIIYLKNLKDYQSLHQVKSSWINNIPSIFTTTVSTQQGYRGQSAFFTFKLTNLLSLGQGKTTYVILKFNDLFGELTANTSNGILISSRSVRFDITNSITAQLYLNLITPQIFGNYTFLLSTYYQISNGSSYLIAQSTSNIWQHTCYNTICRACDTLNNNLKCLDCYPKSISNFYIYDSQKQTCRRDCVQGYFLNQDGNICSPCATNCLQCLNISSNCTSCSAQKKLFLDGNYKKCVQKCQDGYYANTQLQKCIICNSPCLYCEGTGSKCTYCPAGKFLLNSDCLQSCPSNGQYISNLTTRSCVPCNSNCLTCVNFITSCTSCNTSLLLYLQNNLCVLECKSNSFINIETGSCLKCQSPCNLCYNNSDVCSTCLTNTSTPIWYNFKCINQSQCPSGNYVNKQNSSCNACSAQCVSCSSLTLCLACTTDYNLYQGTCLTKCPNITYPSSKICYPCTGCQTCQNTYKNCTSCIPNQYLYQGLCYSVCPKGTFKNITQSKCLQCSTDCPTCLNLTYCQTCLSDLYFYVGKCYVQCPISSFESMTNATNESAVLICDKCPQKCLACSSLSSCQSCKSPYSLQNDSICVQTCSKGISYQQVCYPCGLHCATCQSTIQQCKLCDSPYLLYDNKCLSSCPSNTLSLNNLTCVSCSVKFGQFCKICNVSQCLSCSDGELTNGECFPCPEGYYSKNNKCTKCPSSCKSCKNETYCFSCQDNFYMQKNFCVSKCPLNKIPSGTECVICLQNCTVCNLTNSLCQICNSGLYLFQYRCVEECPNPLIINIDYTKCVTKQKYAQQYSKQAKIVYFPFTIASIILIIIGIVIKCNSNITNLGTLLVAVLGFTQIGSWSLFLFVQNLAFINYHYDSMKSLGLAIAAIISLVIIGIINVKFYCKYLLDDPYFSKWVLKHNIIDKIFLTLSVIFNFKIYRIVYSRLLDRSQFSQKLITLNKLKPFSLISIISILACSIPIMVGCSLALYFSISTDYQFFAALDCLSVTSIMLILVLIDLRHDSTYFFIQIQSANINVKKQIYQDQDDLKISINEQVNSQKIMGLMRDQKNMSKADLLDRDNQNQQNYEDSGAKFRGRQTGFQKTRANTGFRTTNNFHRKNILKKGQIEVIDLENNENLQNNNQDLQFQVQSDAKGDQAIFMPQNNQNALESQPSFDQISSQISHQSQQKKQKWSQIKYDRFGYLLKTNQKGVQQKYDQYGHRVQIDDQGKHHKFDKDGNQVVQLKKNSGQFYIKDKLNPDKHFWKQGKKYDKRQYEIKENQNGQQEYYDQNGFRVQQDEQGKIIKYDQYGHQIIIDTEGKVKRYNKQGYQAFISNTGKITYKDSQGYSVRFNGSQFQRYDPQDGFILKTNPNTGKIQKYDKQGYRIQKDQWGNIHRYDNNGYRVVLGVQGQVIKFDKDGYRIEINDKGEIRRLDKEGYQVRIDSNGKKKLYDSNGYEVVKDYYGNITLIQPKTGYKVVIDPLNKQHRKYTKQGLLSKIVKEQNGNQKEQFYDKRGNKVVQFQDGYYQKYDQKGNKIWLDQDGFETQNIEQEGQVKRYDKVGNFVDQQKFIQEKQEIIEEGDPQIMKKIKKFKEARKLDYQAQYSKMIADQRNVNQEESLSQQPNLKQFHDYEPIDNYDLEIQLQTLRDHQLGKQHLLVNQDEIALEQLKQIDYNPQKQLNTKNGQQNEITNQLQNNQPIESNIDELKVVNPLQQDNKQDQIQQLKSIADASINQRSFQNQGVQPIQDIQVSHCSEFESIEQFNPTQNKVKRNKNQRSQVSFNQGQSDTKTQYNHNKRVNVQVKNKKIYDQDQEIQSLNEDDQNWIQRAQINFMQQNQINNKPNNFSNANTNTNMNELVFMDDVQEQYQANMNNNQSRHKQSHDILSDFVKLNSSHKQKSINSQNKSKARYNKNKYQDKNTIQQIQEQLFRREMNEQGIKQRTEFKLSNGPNPLVEYAKNLQANKKSLNQRMYLQEISKKKKKRR